MNLRNILPKVLQNSENVLQKCWKKTEFWFENFVRHPVYRSNYIHKVYLNRWELKIRPSWTAEITYFHIWEFFHLLSFGEQSFQNGVHGDRQINDVVFTIKSVRCVLPVAAGLFHRVKILIPRRSMVCLCTWEGAALVILKTKHTWWNRTAVLRRPRGPRRVWHASCTCQDSVLRRSVCTNCSSIR